MLRMRESTLGLAVLDLLVNFEAFADVLLLRHLEAHHMVTLDRDAVDGEAGGIRPAMLERLEHRGHFGPDVAA